MAYRRQISVLQTLDLDHSFQPCSTATLRIDLVGLLFIFALARSIEKIHLREFTARNQIESVTTRVMLFVLKPCNVLGSIAPQSAHVLLSSGSWFKPHGEAASKVLSIKRPPEILTYELQKPVKLFGFEVVV